MVPVKLVYLSYFVSSAYVLSHSVACGIRAKDRRRNSTGKELDAQIRNKSAFSPSIAFLDTLIWQGLASVIIPGLLINRTCALSRLLLHQLFRRKLVGAGVMKWTVTGIGLGSIPFIIHPIDKYGNNYGAWVPSREGRVSNSALS